MLCQPLTEQQARLKNPLSLAFLGDTVWDLLVGQGLLRSELRAHDVHKEAVRRVNAGAQAAFAKALEPMLTEAEADIFRRGCNAHAHHAAPKNQDKHDYSLATGLEAVMGYLYLTGQEQRISELFDNLHPFQ